MIVKKYSKYYFNEWNVFVKNSKNATFLIDRNYMEYHSHKFVDYSLMIFNDKLRLVALLPLSLHEKEVISHGGLTYGGFVVDHTMSTENMLAIFEEVIKFLEKNKIKKITYKAIPHIYHIRPAEEDLYALFRNEFLLTRRDVSSTINMRTTRIKGKKINGYKKAKKLGLVLEKTDNSRHILNIAKKNILKKYNVNVVHTPNEMDLLHSKFNNNIHMYNLIYKNEVIGGAILYLDKKVIHAQYIATTENAKRMRGLDFIIVSIINLYKDKYEWFDFGISTENYGKYLNTNLINSKEEFNMSAICYDTYELIIK